MSLKEMFENRGAYAQLSSKEDGVFDGSTQETPGSHVSERKASNRLHQLAIAIALIIAAAIGFAAGSLLTAKTPHGKGNKEAFEGRTPRIPIPTILREFAYDTPFSQEPPQGEGSGSASEPIWDTLVPSKPPVVP